MGLVQSGWQAGGHGFARQYGAVHCIISGGAAMMVAPHLSITCSRVDNLALIGLQTVLMKQNTPC